MKIVECEHEVEDFVVGFEAVFERRDAGGYGEEAGGFGGGVRGHGAGGLTGTIDDLGHLGEGEEGDVGVAVDG